MKLHHVLLSSVLLAIVFLASGVSSALAQSQYPPEVPDSKARTEFLALRMQDQYNPATDQKKVLDYANYELARWTESSSVNKIPSLRRGVETTLKSLASKQQLHDAFAKELLEQATLRAKDQARKYHPAVRVNATLMISRIYAVENTSSSTPAEPLPDAIKQLVELIGLEGVGDAVKVAALVGLEHQASLGIPDELKPGVLATMGRVLVSSCPQQRSPGGHAWMQMIACRVIAEMKPRASQPMLNVLSGLVVDSKIPMHTRCESARTIGELAAGEQGLDLGPATSALGMLARDACTLERLGANQAKFDAERIRYRLQCALAGMMGPDPAGLVITSDGSIIAGVKALMPAQADAGLFTGMAAAIKRVIDVLDSRSATDPDKQAAVKDLEGKLLQVYPRQ